jgi:predicted RNase H-like HicB family nuclease
VEETLGNVKEAIELYLDVLREEGHPIPRDEEVVFKVSVAA